MVDMARERVPVGVDELPVVIPSCSVSPTPRPAGKWVELGVIGPWLDCRLEVDVYEKYESRLFEGWVGECAAI